MRTKIVLKPSMAEMTSRYRKAMNKVTNFKPLFKDIAVLLDRWNKLNFKTEGDKVGGWKPLALRGRWIKGTKSKKRWFDASAMILQDTGRLRLSYLPFASNAMAGIGSDLDYAQSHHEGWGKLPERRMVPEATEVLPEVMKIADRHTEKALAKLRQGKMP